VFELIESLRSSYWEMCRNRNINNFVQRCAVVHAFELMIDLFEKWYGVRI
jgi:hypothetical protein